MNVTPSGKDPKRPARNLFVRAIIIMMCLIHFSALYAQNNGFTIKLQNVTLEKVFDQIKNQSSYTFFYEHEGVEKTKNVNVDAKNASINEIMRQALKTTIYTYQIVDKVIVIKLAKTEKKENNVEPITGVQDVYLSGHVMDKEGNPLSGVNVLIKGTMKGTVTDIDGKYSIKVPNNTILIFSFLGYTRKEIATGNKTEINITMFEEVSTLKEVTVNAGYYTVKEKERTGSIAKVSAKEIENQPVTNVLSAVQGRMAGVNITQSSGVPGGGYSIQIRGTNSLRREGNYPMYIIDGIVVSSQTPSNSISAGILPYTVIDPLNAINPNDIESIEILKDADATAIYGSRGANGVILITTKKGKAGNKTSLSVNSSYGISRVANKMDMMNTEQYLEMRRQAYANDGITSYPSTAYDINGTWDQTRYTDWQKELIGKTAINSSTQFSISGGNENTNFIISGSHNEQTTVFGNDFKYKTNNLSGNFIHHSIDNKFKLNASGQFSDQSNNLITSDITSNSLLLSPNAPALYNEDGSLNWANSTWTNPVASYLKTYSNKNRTFNSNINLEYELLRSLYIKFNGGINQLVFNERTISPNTVYNPSYGLTSANSGSQVTQSNRFSYQLEPQINYKYSYKGHTIDILFGGTYQQMRSTVLNISSYIFPTNALITNLTAAQYISIIQDVVTEYKYAALFGRINYQFNNRYFLNFTWRRDGSSRFGQDKRFANFGAVGAAWIFSEENFLKENSLLSFGKLRASYGLTGSDLIGDYQYLDTYTVSSKIYGDNTSLYPSRLNNPYFSWEKTTKLELALELGFIKDRIKFNTAWYRNRSGNQLVGVPLPATTGFSSIQANLPATVQNTGLEFEINTNPLKLKNFNWNSNFNISLPKNKLIAFPGLEGSTYASTYTVGYPLSIKKVYNYEGIDPETGLYKFTDYNNDGKISSPEDNKVIENVGVKYFGGWYNQFNYKNLELSILFQFVNQKQENYNVLMSYPGTKNNQPIEVLNVWSEENPNGKYMPYTTGANSQKNKLLSYFKSSTAAISDASYIRLKNIQLSYNLSINKYLKDVRFYLQGQNIWTITNYFGVDPEFVRTGFLPPLKTWSFGVQLNF